MTEEHSSPYAVTVDATSHHLWKDKIPLLGRLDMELTERCNNNCIHCCINLPEDDKDARRRELSTDEIKGILTEAAVLGAMSVRFTGGEPLIRDDFTELYLFARKLGMKVMLFTNGRLITPEIADLLARVPPLEKIEITVYGMTKESYEAVARVPGSYDEFRRGMQLLMEKGIPFVVKGALLPPNRDEIDEFEAWAATIPAMDTSPSYSMFFDLRCRRDFPEKNRQIATLRLSPEDGVSVLSRDRERYLKSMREFCSKFMRPSGKKLLACGAGHGGCVDAYGMYQPCMMLRHPDCVYDLRSGSLEDSMTNYFPKLREMEAENPEYLARCARCFIKGLCEQCPAKSWMEHGTLDTPVEYLCGVAHAQAYDLGLLEEDEKAWEVEDWQERIDRFVNEEHQ
ncbi:radical SAM protein [Methanogenium sp. S4BF]|uniref:radical SAM protein n=1 Tax=Methanogenium sp. S4BF TaxID=1789226 RepID=UPI0024164CDB|nr:radical SAM protein [Methanogenium sp. S4BF]WFN33519.1 radical SAM protein [Methanogenium sp. S4BF]